ncbi:MAG: hypothetical protein ACTSO3_01365 [Candidatus Heimdallarchaeaceae archaeon]
MKPIKFKESNCTYAKDQPEYLPLPVYRSEEPEGDVISCWKLTWRERLKILFTGCFWFSQLTFHQPLQPQLPMIDKPFKKDKK